MNFTKREKTGLYIFGVVMLMVISYMYFSNRNKGEIKVSASLTPTVEAKAAPSEGAGEIRAYICGSVCKPGVYTLLDGDRVDALVAMAGGATGDADLSAINLAERLQDEQYVWVPAKGEEGVIPSISKTGASSSQTQGMVNINTASTDELDSLPGIGPAIASKIISYREEHGKFTSIEQIKEVSGIGDSKYESIKNQICVK